MEIKYAFYLCDFKFDLYMLHLFGRLVFVQDAIINFPIFHPIYLFYRSRCFGSSVLHESQSPHIQREISKVATSS